MHIVLLHFYKSPNPVYDQIATGLRACGHKVWMGYVNQTGYFEWHDGERPIAVEGKPIRVDDSLLGHGILSLILRRVVFFGIMLRIRRFLRQNKPDIVQIYPIGTYGSWLLPLFMPTNMRFILDFRQAGMGSDVGRRLSGLRRLRDWFSNQERQVLGEFIFDRILFCDARAARMCLGERWSRWATAIPAGVGSHFLTFEHGEPDSQSSNERVQFVYLGVIGRFRQLERLFYAIQRVKGETDQFHVTLIGPNVSGSYYQHLVEELGMKDVITIKPPLPYEEVPAEIARYDVALAYIPGNIPDWRYQPTLKALEYRALGMPVIAPDNPPSRELVEDRVNGLIVQDSCDDWARAILELITDREIVLRLRANAHKMRKGLPWRSISTLYEATYETLLHSTSTMSLAKAPNGHGN